MPTVGMENITLRPPAFFQALVSAVEGCIDSLPPSAGLSLEDRIQQATFQLVGSKELAAIPKLIHDQFGYVLEEIILNTAPVINASMMVAVTLPPPTKASPIEGYKGFQKTLTGLAGQIHLESGVLNSPETYNPHIQTHLSTLLFLLPEYYPTLGIGASEIAAVILHELGHCYDYIAVFQTGSLISGLADQLCQYQPSVLTVDDVAEVALACRKALEETTGAKRPELIAFTKELSTLNLSLTKGTPPTQDTLRSLLSYITSVTAYSLASLQVTTLTSLSLRHSLVFKTDEYHTRDERTADAFAARYGAGKDLVRFLQGYQYFNQKYKTISLDKTSVSSLYNTLLYKLSPWQILMSGLNIAPTLSIGGYDNDLKRLTEICNALYGGLKDPTLDKAMRYYYVKQIDAVKELIRKWESYPDIKLRKFFYGSLPIYLKAGAAAFHLFIEDLEQQYDKLQRLTKDYVDNPLFYQSARLAQLADKTS